MSLDMDLEDMAVEDVAEEDVAEEDITEEVVAEEDMTEENMTSEDTASDIMKDTASDSINLVNREDYTYILPMDTANTPRSTDNLWNLRPFLREPKDVLLVDELIALELPLKFVVGELESHDEKSSGIESYEEESHEEKSHEEESHKEESHKVVYLCIKTFPGELPSDLVPYANFLGKGPPHLAVLLYRGSLDRSSLDRSSLDRSSLDKSSQEKYPDTPETATLEKDSLIGTIAEKALASKDIFLIHGQGLNPKIFAEIIRRLFNKKSSETFSKYKKRIQSQNRPDFSLVDKIELAKINFEQYAFTYQATISTLQEVYFAALPQVKGDVLKSLNQTISAISIGIASIQLSAAEKRLLRCIHALPCNEIVYEDDGDASIEEVILRLEHYLRGKTVPKLQEGLDTLKELSQRELSQVQAPNQDFFDQIKKVQNNMITALHPKKDPYISKDHKNMVLSVMETVIQALHLAAEEEHKLKNAVLLEYLAEIKPETIQKYLNPEDGTRPFFHKGVVVADTDACWDESAILETALTAKKLILLGSRTDGLFGLFSKACAAAQFISYSFDENVDEAKDENDENDKNKDKNSTIHWIYKNSQRKPLVSHVNEMTALGYSIGIWTTGPDKTKELQDFGVDIDNITVGTLSDIYQDTFDVLYWMVPEESDSATHDYNRGLNIAQSKAKHLLAIVGDPTALPEDSILKDIFDKCAGDDKYGKIFK